MTYEETPHPDARPTNFDEPAMSSETDGLARNAFERLRIDAAAVNVDAAWNSRARTGANATAPASSSGQSRGPIVWLAAAAVLAVALIGGISLLSRDTPTTLTTTNPVDRAPDSIADPTSVPESGIDDPLLPAGPPPLAELASIALPGEWELTRGEIEDGKVFYGGEPVSITLEVQQGQLVGSAGCNTYTAAVINGAVGPIASTKMACVGDEVNIMAIENEYLKALAKVDTLIFDDGILGLLGGGATLEFRSTTTTEGSGPAPATDQDYKLDDVATATAVPAATAVP